MPSIHGVRGRRPELTAPRWEAAPGKEAQDFDIESAEKKSSGPATPATINVWLSAACSVTTAKSTPFSNS
jgi:hypothetical protein